VGSAGDKFVHHLVLLPGIFGQIGFVLLIAQSFQRFNLRENLTQLFLTQVSGLPSLFGGLVLQFDLLAQGIDVMDFLEKRLGAKSILHQLVPAVEGVILLLVQRILPLLFLG